MFKHIGIALALSLSACAQPIAIGGAPVAIGEDVLVKSTDALSIAADAYAATATVAAAAVRQGAFTDDQLRMIRTLNNHADGLLRGSDATLTQAQRAASLIATITQLKSILARK